MCFDVVCSISASFQSKSAKIIMDLTIKPLKCDIHIDCCLLHCVRKILCRYESPKPKICRIIVLWPPDIVSDCWTQTKHNWVRNFWGRNALKSEKAGEYDGNACAHGLAWREPKALLHVRIKGGNEDDKTSP